MKNLSKLVCLSLTYNANGHSKDYVDSFANSLQKDYEIDILCFGKPKEDNDFIKYCEGDAAHLDYVPNQILSTHRKIIRRFFASLRLYGEFFLLKKLRSERLYFLDYEYLSLALLLKFVLKDKKKYILLHSVSDVDGGSKGLYKKLFFRMISGINNVEFIVNGEKSLEIIRNRTSNKVSLIQYPTELKVTRVKKDEAKVSLRLKKKLVISLIGMIRKDKNYSKAIEAFAKSNLCNDDNCQLVIAGYPSNVKEDEINYLLNANGVRNYTFIPRYLTEDELNICFSASDYLLVPYGDGGTSQSGPLSQARLYHLPAIVQANGEIGDYVSRENVGFTFESFPELTELLNGLNCRTDDFDFSTVNNKYSWSQARISYLNIFSSGPF
ncbi:glycosyltransferase [Photobacterium lipolyticum]|uniref:Glycosyl transferase family 1 domain-containing protein n=1 Tax=Photobacterium lipolyticum TaxID=266810 RepID=A0A2T3MVF9_9GAMM|nr:glycosyltransferase [Photobacterium lipolyticum]PSW03864.1 hypothetical protein C9I89_15850 [Photobacterium lipolyticum]